VGVCRVAVGAIVRQQNDEGVLTIWAFPSGEALHRVEVPRFGTFSHGMPGVTAPVLVFDDAGATLFVRSTADLKPEESALWRVDVATGAASSWSVPVKALIESVVPGPRDVLFLCLASNGDAPWSAWTWGADAPLVALDGVRGYDSVIADERIWVMGHERWAWAIDWRTLRANPTAPRVGEVIDGQWRLLARLGGGGMGEVYRAEHVDDGRVVAVKLLRPELASSAMHARRVLREGQTAALVSHPNIVRIEDLGIDDQGVPYLVQEFLDGIDLATYAQYRRGPVPARDLIPLMLPIFDALGALHDAGVVHRDLKPENIFLVRDGSGWSPRLLDFGLAVIVDHLDDAPLPPTSSVALGSPAYMSPEQFRDTHHLTARSDLWSLGVMLYELLSGVMPFAGDSVAELARAVADEDPIPLDRRVPGIPSALARAVMRCLEKNPAPAPPVTTSSAPSKTGAPWTPARLSTRPAPVVGRPSWPTSFSPQHHTWPLARRAQACSPPAATWATGDRYASESSARPSTLTGTGAHSLLSAQSTSPIEEPARPRLAPPQQRTSPPARAHEKKSPTPREVTPVRPGICRARSEAPTPPPSEPTSGAPSWP
jgi:serine/threonine protein kinase